MAFRRRRSTFRGSTGSIGWISWNGSGKDGTLGLGRCLRPLPGFRILGRTALETLPDGLVERRVPGRIVGYLSLCQIFARKAPGLPIADLKRVFCSVAPGRPGPAFG